MKALIIYSSRDGQTRKIAHSMAETVQTKMACDVCELTSGLIPDWSVYDRVLIGASIRYGHFPPLLDLFINQHLAEIEFRINGFFAVNLTARKPEKSTPETNSYTQKFLIKSPWKPMHCAVFAGALRYPAYRWIDKVMIRLIMKMTGGETDTSKEIEYTNWSQVEDFAQNFSTINPSRH